MLRKVFGPKRDKVTGMWKRLHNEKLPELYVSPNIIPVIKSRIMRWAGNVARVGDRTGACWVLVGKPERKRPPG
jgi:hypothetical protein